MKQARAVVHKAQPIADEHIPDLRIVAVKSLPVRRDSKANTVRRDSKANTDLQLKDAEKIVEALTASLPGGTLDRVFALLAMQRASGLIVSRKSLEQA